MNNTTEHNLNEAVRELHEANPHLTESQIQQVFNKTKEKMLNEPPPFIAVIGPCGAGKSSTINALFKVSLPVSHTVACTQDPIPVTVTDDRGKTITVCDMAGFFESDKADVKHWNTYNDILQNKADGCLYIFDAPNRNLKNLQDSLRILHEIAPDMVKRMSIGLSKYDNVHPLKWHPQANIPSPEQIENVTAICDNVQRKILEVIPDWTGHIVPFSSEKAFQIPHLFNALLKTVTHTRKWIVADRRNLADFTAHVDPDLLPQPITHSPTPEPELSKVQRLLNEIRTLSKEEFKQIALSIFKG